MVIRKPSISVNEARLRSSIHNNGSSDCPRHADAIRSDTAKSELAAKPMMQARQHSQPQNEAPSYEKRPRRPVSPGLDADRTVDALTPQSSTIKTQIFLLAYPPAPGVSSIFDSLRRQYPPSKSLQMILRRAFDDYETMIECGTFRTAPSSYEILRDSRRSPPVQTSRMVATEIVSLARSHFDPMAMETSRAFGLKLATAALATFFAVEP
ncbi:MULTISPECIES: VirC2 family conjugal transfer protein [unclassified Rhizobium]|uniref:VirC2 family conjugal transfer protein n=1 Tax=unclassified Rhizobium TaxID=2613769 RepID=UPI00178655AC|nr:MULTISPECIES: VirC2 family conjugal transfer protein [unclassified Rhizobium]MBD8689869.1 VirC2 family conjugal transfer protein [Rhizobium sp. CFBP 13644]MBD8694458.1 VirC2 family conjugal transfer protein [Rhizobium sp. CFBP 13717]